MDKIRYDNNFVTKTKKRLIIKIGLIVLYLLISLIFSRKISKLSLITSQGLFGDNVTYWSILYFILIVFSLVLFIGAYFFLSKEDNLRLIETKKGNIYYQVYDYLQFILLTLCTFFVCIMFIFTPCTVVGSSMNDTYYEGDKLVVWHLAYKPKRDDVVVIFADENHYSLLSYDFILKRVVAVPNDKIRFESTNLTQGNLYVNDVLVENNIHEEQYKKITGLSNLDEFIIPEKKYIVMGDNRNNSTDSRAIGLIYQEDILGKVILRTYPFNKFGSPSKNIRD